MAVVTSELDRLCSATSFTRSLIDSWCATDARYFLAKEAPTVRSGHQIPKIYCRKARCHLIEQETLEPHVLDKLYAGMYTVHADSPVAYSCLQKK